MKKESYYIPVLSCLTAMQSQALDFSNDSIEGSFNSSFSVGSSWRMEKPDEKLVQGANSNDGNANFDEGEEFSRVYKGSHDLQISYQNFGGFIRGKYWYDARLEDGEVDHGHGPTASVDSDQRLNHPGKSKLDDSDFDDLAKFSGAELMDAYVYGDFDIYDTELSVRLGRQVVSWGESTFIRGGVNAINPLDASALTQPGSEVKDALLPVNMAYANIGLTENLSMEAFYQLEFQETVLPGCGTYFAPSDFVAKGCDFIAFRGYGFERLEEDGYRTPDADGQYGLSFRFSPESLDDSEFGVYFMNIHSRDPFVSGVRSDLTGAEQQLIAQTAGGQYLASIGAAPQTATAEQLATAQLVGQEATVEELVRTSGYYTTFPEDIQLYGLSFATSLDAFAVSGEVTHKKDVPLQINSTQLLAGSVSGGTSSLADLGLDSTVMDAELAAVEPGGNVDGFKLFDISQAQVTVIGFIDRILAADRFTFVGEAGYTYVHDLEEGDNQIRFGRPSVFNAEGDTEGFVTTESWGYRASLEGEYSDVFAGVNMSPKVVWKHDVSGFAPKNSSSFNEGRQSLGFSVYADYLATYNASISYTQFMGGDYNIRSDRDFASITMGMQF